MILKVENFVMFFRHRDDFYGTDENNRLVFAKMKYKNDPDHNLFVKEAQFTATKLNGDKKKKTFSSKDLPEIKVIDPRKELK